MRRRKFIALLGAAAAWPRAARTQQPAEKLPRIGSIQNFRNENFEAFIQGLREAGYVDESDGYGGQRKRRVTRDGLYDQARRISPRLKGASDTALGLYLREHGCVNAWVQRRRGWQFPPLKECRKRWEDHFPATVWFDPNTTEWTFGDD